MSDAQQIERRLIELDVEHRDLDTVIELLILDGHHDELQLRRLKKRKLQLKASGARRTPGAPRQARC